jgi:transcriptional regulator with XRE-family HTH domain
LWEAVVVVSADSHAQWYERPEARAALSARDIGEVYRLLQQEGVSQREIARRTGQSQSEVSEILHGRQVRDVELLERIADGLSVPRAYLRLLDDPENAYPEGVTVTGSPQEVEEEMLRRVLLAAGVSLAGGQIATLRTRTRPAPVPLPARIEGIQVAQVRSLTRQLGEAANPAITAPEVLSAATTWAEKLLTVPGTEAVKQALLVAVAELHIEAGWAGFDALHYGRAVHHFTTALQLATTAGDTYLQATALNYAGWVVRESGRPNEGLKLLQAAQVKAWAIPADEPRAVVVGQVGRAAVEASAMAQAATALADLGDLDTAGREIAHARQLWSPTHTDRFGDLDRPAALLALRQGKLDTAEPLAAASLRRWEGISQHGHTQSSIVLATIHVQAGEHDSLPMAHHAITAVRRLGSALTRRRLQPLAAALETRPGRDTHDLARMAQQTISTRT